MRLYFRRTLIGLIHFFLYGREYFCLNLCSSSRCTVYWWTSWLFWWSSERYQRCSFSLSLSLSRMPMFGVAIKSFLKLRYKKLRLNQSWGEGAQHADSKTEAKLFSLFLPWSGLPDHCLTENLVFKGGLFCKPAWSCDWAFRWKRIRDETADNQ